MMRARAIAAAAGLVAVLLLVSGCAIAQHPRATVGTSGLFGMDACRPSTATITVGSAGSTKAASGRRDRTQNTVAAAWLYEQIRQDGRPETIARTTTARLEPVASLEKAFGRENGTDHDWVMAIVRAALEQHRVPTGWGTPIPVTTLPKPADADPGARSLVVVEATELQAPARVSCGGVTVDVAVVAPNPASYGATMVDCAEPRAAFDDELVSSLCVRGAAAVGTSDKDVEG